MALDVGFLGLALGAGAATFFSPCSVGLLPSYIAFFIGTRSKGEETRDAVESVWQGARFGVIASLGFLAVFTVCGAAFGFLGSRIVAPYITTIALAIGVAILVLGILYLTPRSPALSIPLRAPELKGPFSIFLFGAAYALASLGCTLPLFLSFVLGSLLTAGLAEGILVYAVYALGMGLVMVAVSALLGAGRGHVVARVRSLVPLVKKASGAVMVLAGGYIVYYYVSFYLTFGPLG